LKKKIKNFNVDGKRKAIADECSTNSKKLNNEQIALLDKVIKSDAIINKPKSKPSEAQKKENNTLRNQLTQKLTEIEDYKLSCRNRNATAWNEYLELINKNPSYNYSRNLNSNVRAGQYYDVTRHVCCPNTHEFGRIDWNGMPNFVVCYKK